MQPLEFTTHTVRYAALAAFGIPAALVPILGLRITAKAPAVERTTGMLSLSALTLSIVNLADKQPPYVQNGNLAFDPQNASAIGRMVSVGINGRW